MVLHTKTSPLSLWFLQRGEGAQGDIQPPQLWVISWEPLPGFSQQGLQGNVVFNHWESVMEKGQDSQKPAPESWQTKLLPAEPK